MVMEGIVVENKLNKPIKVESVTKFLDCIIEGRKQKQEQKQKQKQYNFYYRGENAKFSYRTPNLYREEELVREGSEYYYRSLLNELGRTDYKDGSSLFQLLSELQHYGAKTRMLDITSNPLVALYFATEEGRDGDDGYVYLFREEKDKEKFDTGHTIAIKSALNLISQNKINTFLMILTEIDDYLSNSCGIYGCLLYNNVEELIENVESWEDFFTIYEEELRFINLPIDNIVETQEEYDSIYYEFTINIEKRQEILKAILKRILSEFLDLLTQRAKTNEELKYPFRIFRDLLDSHIVLSSKRTERLRQQQGAFIYPCFTNTSKNFSKIPLENIKEIIHNSIMTKSARLNYQEQEYTHIVIPKDKKKVIQEQLALIGIDAGFIYPDIKHRSEALLN